jgi:hypothetical protein
MVGMETGEGGGGELNGRIVNVCKKKKEKKNLWRALAHAFKILAVFRSFHKNLRPQG